MLFATIALLSRKNTALLPPETVLRCVNYIHKPSITLIIKWGMTSLKFINILQNKRRKTKLKVHLKFEKYYYFKSVKILILIFKICQSAS